MEPIIDTAELRMKEGDPVHPKTETERILLERMRDILSKSAVAGNDPKYNHDILDELCILLEDDSLYDALCDMPSLWYIFNERVQESADKNWDPERPVFRYLLVRDI